MILTALLSTFLSIATPQDTVVVSTAQVSQPIAAMPVYQTDSLNMGGKAYDENEFYRLNASASFLKHQPTTPISYGDTLSQGDTDGALYLLKFRVSSERYATANLSIPEHFHKIRQYTNGTESYGDLIIKPGVTEVALLCKTDTSAVAVFDLKLIGTNIQNVCILDADDLEPLTLAMMSEGAHYADVRLSPTGKYLITVYYDQSPEGTAEYWTTLTETRTGRVVTRQSGSQPWRWHRTRDEIWYVRSWNKTQQLVYRTVDGEERVVAEGLPNKRIVLSPSEDYLIYTDEEDARQNAGPLRRLEQPDDRMPGWASRGSLFRYDLQTGVTQRLSYGRETMWLYDISPDGKKLLMGYDRMQPNRQPFNRVTILEMDAAMGSVDTLLLDTAFISSALYTADGSSLLIQGSPDAFGGIGSELPNGVVGNMFDKRLFRYDIADRTVTPLLMNFNASVEKVMVPQQGDNIYLTATEGYGCSLWRLNVKSLERVRYDLPISYVQRVSIAMSEQKPTCVFTGFSGERSRECFLTELSAKSRVRCQRIGEVSFDSIYQHVALGSCHDWNFLSSRGDTIQGFYFLPANFDPSKQYPLIVYYYGGCTPTPKMFEFRYPHAVLAAQGYVVYVVEPSGAIGYSQEFAARHVGTWGRESADDIIDGTRAFAAAHPFIDASRIGCIGASYGGFMTQYLQTRTDLFRTAISHAGISNIASYWGGGYWGYTYGEAAQYGQYPWNNPELYTQQSPLFNADKIHTPLLLLHGTVDTNVPTTESQQLFTALRILGRPVSYVQIDGENHVVQNKEKMTLWQETIFAWFAYWLKDQHEWWESLFPGDTFGL